MTKSGQEFHGAAQLLCSHSCPQDKDHMGLTLFCILHLQIPLWQGETRMGDTNPRQEAAVTHRNTLGLLSRLPVARGSWQTCDIPSLRAPKDWFSWSSKEVLRVRPTEGSPSESFCISNCSFQNCLRMTKKCQSGKVAPNIRETPSNTYSQLQNARLDPVRHQEQRQRRDQQRTTENFVNSKPDTDGLS